MRHFSALEQLTLKVPDLTTMVYHRWGVLCRLRRLILETSPPVQQPMVNMRGLLPALKSLGVRCVEFLAYLSLWVLETAPLFPLSHYAYTGL